jgi:uncharacterized protein (DUF1697 family)
MPTSIVLLRGVNVGGHKLSMAELRQVLEDDGYTDVKTYIQSGNVVLTHKPAPDAKFAAALEARISALAGYRVPLTLRSEAEMKSVVKRNPFDARDPTKLVVWFLNERPAARALKGLDEIDIGKEAYKLSGRELYLSLPNGQAEGILPVALGKLKVPALKTATARNWRTVEKLLDLANSD